MVLGGRGSVDLSHLVTHHPLKRDRERWIFYNRGVILTLIHWLGPPFFSVVIRTHTSNLE